jgi:hypothetical protein
MHYHYFTIEQRESLENLIRSSMAGRPENDRPDEFGARAPA